MERRTVILLVISWLALSILVLAYAVTYDTPFLAFLVLFLFGVWFLLFASFLGSPRVSKSLQGRQWTFLRTMCILAIILTPIILLEILAVTSMLAFFLGLIVVGFIVGWRARSSWIAFYSTLLAALVTATVLTLYFYVEPGIPTYLDYMATLGFSAIFFFGCMVPTVVLGIAVAYLLRSGSRRTDAGGPVAAPSSSIETPDFSEFPGSCLDGRAPSVIRGDRDEGRRWSVNLVLLAGMMVAIVAGFIHDPSPIVGRYEESLVWQWVSIVGAEIALLGAGIDAGARPVLGVGKALLVAALAAAWFATLMFDPSPALSWGNMLPLLAFLPATAFSVLYTLGANYLI